VPERYDSEYMFWQGNFLSALCHMEEEAISFKFGVRPDNIVWRPATYQKRRALANEHCKPRVRKVGKSLLTVVCHALHPEEGWLRQTPQAREQVPHHG